MQQFFSFVIAVIIVLWLYLTYKWIRAIFDEDNSKLLNTAVYAVATGILIVAAITCLRFIGFDFNIELPFEITMK